MKRKGKPETEEFHVEQEVKRTGVTGRPWDLIIEFKQDVPTQQIYVDEDVKTIIEGLLQRYGRILVKINWFDSDLMVIAPDNLPDASQTRQEGS